MRYLAVVLALAACGDAVLGSAEEPPPRDGAWLQSGIKAYRRLNAHQSLSDQEADRARLVTSYVCAVVDTERHLAQRANLLSAALQQGGERKQHLDSRVIGGMRRALPMIVPMMKTGFLASDPSCEQVLPIVESFLEKYPEVLDKDADVVVEKALLDAYELSDAP